MSYILLLIDDFPPKEVEDDLFQRLVKEEEEEHENQIEVNDDIIEEENDEDSSISISLPSGTGGIKEEFQKCRDQISLRSPSSNSSLGGDENLDNQVGTESKFNEKHEFEVII